MPFRIFALGLAASIYSKYFSGNYLSVEKASEDARKWLKWGLIIGITFYTLYCLYFLHYHDI